MSTVWRKPRYFISILTETGHRQFVKFTARKKSCSLIHIAQWPCMKATNKSKITDIISKVSTTLSVTSGFSLFCLLTPYWGRGRKGAFSYLLHYPLEQTSSHDFVWTWSDTPQTGKQEILRCRRWSLPKVPFCPGQLDLYLIQSRLKQLWKRNNSALHYC